MVEKLLEVIIIALKQVQNPRFYCSERGYQGEFSSNLKALFGKNNIMPDETIVEQEYQKTIPNHGISHRPDTIVHIPFEKGRARTREEGNFVAIEFKLKANKRNALEDFSKLNDYINILKYPLGIFVNIGSQESFIEFVPNDKIHVFNVLKTQENVILTHSYLKDGKIISEKI